jgi:hypothetical protein
MSLECPREHDIVTATLARGWPDQCDEALQAHARQCPICRDIVELVTSLRDERDCLQEVANVPGAGQVWWRAAVRARLEATQAAARPLTWLYGVAGACASGLLIASVGLLWPPVRHASVWVSAHASTTSVDWSVVATAFTPFAQSSGFVLVGAATCVVLAPLALYLALSDE